VIAYEHLQIASMVKNRRLAKSISDASWGRLLRWLKYYGQVYDVQVIAVEPAFTSQDCSTCGRTVQKSLSVRTHVCPGCGLVLDRDHNEAHNILAKACRTGGQSGTGTPQRVQNASGQATATCRSARATRT
jgi:putative transposase